MSKKCVNCGVILDDDALFCSECGVKQNVVENKCANCGAVLVDGAKFCMNCGTPVGKASPAHAIRPKKQEETDFEVTQPDENTLSINIKGIPFNMKFIKGGMIGNIEVSDFYLGETVVTQALWQTVMGDNPSKDNSDLQYPVTDITRQIANNFLIRLKKITGTEFSLPTGAQFIYAAINGCRNKQAFEEMHWGDGNKGYAKLHPVCGMMPNQFGLFDLSSWGQIVADNVPAEDNSYSFNPSFKDGLYYARYKAVDKVVFRNPSLTRAIIASALGLRGYNVNTNGGSVDISKTIRIALNIPVAPEIVGVKNMPKKEFVSFEFDPCFNQQESSKDSEIFTLEQLLEKRSFDYALEQRKIVEEKISMLKNEEVELLRRDKKHYFLITENDKKGYIDGSGNIMIPCEYDDSADDFSEGLAWVEKDGKAGFIDKLGRIVVPLVYDTAYGFREGLALVEKNEKYGFIDKSGEEIVSCKYDSADDFSEGLTCVKKDSKCGFIDKSGKEIVSCEYHIAYGFREGLALVEKDGKWGFIDKSGKEVVSCKYYYAEEYHEGLARIGQDRKFGFMDKSGNVVVQCKYDGADHFREGLAKVEKDKKYGFIDKLGRIVIPIEYDKVDRFREGLAVVKKDKKYGFVDKSGKEVVPCQYDFALEFSEGLASVKKGDKWGYIDKSGKTVIPFRWDRRAYPFHDGIARVSIKKEGLEFLRHGALGYIDINGKEITPCIYPVANDFSFGLALIKHDTTRSYIDSSGKVIYKMQ